jgi:hypothetical protein
MRMLRFVQLRFLPLLRADLTGLVDFHSFFGELGAVARGDQEATRKGEIRGEPWPTDSDLCISSEP